MKEQWEYNILRCINSLGGEACLKGIYDKIHKFIELTEEHWKEEYRRPAYQHQIRSHIANLCQLGDLAKMSRGCYFLTKDGQERLMREKSIENAEEI